MLCQSLTKIFHQKYLNIWNTEMQVTTMSEQVRKSDFVDHDFITHQSIAFVKF